MKSNWENSLCSEAPGGNLDAGLLLTRGCTDGLNRCVAFRGMLRCYLLYSFSFSGLDYNHYLLIHLVCSYYGRTLWCPVSGFAAWPDALASILCSFPFTIPTAEPSWWDYLPNADRLYEFRAGIPTNELTQWCQATAWSQWIWVAVLDSMDALCNITFQLTYPPYSNKNWFWRLWHKVWQNDWGAQLTDTTRKQKQIIKNHDIHFVISFGMM